MSFAAFEIGHAYTSRDKVVRIALSAVAIGVNCALWVSELALSVRIEEVDAVAVHANARGVELPAIGISILANSVLIEAISLNASLAFGLLDVVVETVGVLGNAEAISIECIALAASNTDSLGVGITMGDFAGGLVGEFEGICAFNASSFC